MVLKIKLTQILKGGSNISAKIVTSKTGLNVTRCIKAGTQSQLQLQPDESRVHGESRNGVVGRVLVKTETLANEHASSSSKFEEPGDLETAHVDGTTESATLV